MLDSYGVESVKHFDTIAFINSKIGHKNQNNNNKGMFRPWSSQVKKIYGESGRGVAEPETLLGRGGPSPSSLSSSDGISTTRETEAKLVQKPPGVPKSGGGILIAVPKVSVEGRMKEDTGITWLSNNFLFSVLREGAKNSLKGGGGAQ